MAGRGYKNPVSRVSKPRKAKTAPALPGVMKVVAGPSATALAAAVAGILTVPVIPVTLEKNSGGFPDGEVYVRLGAEVRGDTVAVMQSTLGDRNLVELLLIQDAVREAGAAKVVTLVPYFAYARQDKVFEAGEALSVRAMARAIGGGTDRVLTVGVHNRDSLRHFPCPAEDVSGMPAVARYLVDRRLEVIVAPDDGAAHHAEEVARHLKIPWDALEKTRIDALTVRLTAKKVAVAGKRVGIVDEVISTGGTVAAAVKELRTQGATHVSVACLHGLFAGNALERLKGCDDLACSDTLPGPQTKFSVAPEIAAALKRHG